MNTVERLRDGSPKTRSGRGISLAPVMIGVAFLVVCGLSGCGRADTTSSRGSLDSAGDVATPSTCPDSNGPPSRDVLRCRILQASAQGHYARTLSVRDADTLLDALEAYAEAVSDHRDERISDLQYSARISGVDEVCNSLLGDSCGNILFEPVMQ